MADTKPAKKCKCGCKRVEGKCSGCRSRLCKCDHKKKS